jgi:photosystem II stability/assembly factor-like uncharacterized protein
LIQRSEDWGKTWNRVSYEYVQGVSPNKLRYVNCLPSSVCIAVALGYEDLFSDDLGKTWSVMEVRDIPDIKQVSCPTSLMCYGITGSRVYKSSDGGWTWEILNLVDPDRSFTGLSCPDISTCIVHAPYEELFQVGHIYKTTDGGSSWTIVFSHGTGVYPPSTVYCSDVLNCAIFSTYGLYITADGGYNWTGFDNPVGSRVSCIPHEPSCVGTNDGVYITVDLGRSWNKVANLPSTDSGELLIPRAMSCLTLDYCVMIGFNGILLVTWDGGSSWLPYYRNVTSHWFYDISCSTRTDCVAVGEHGIIVRLVGASPWQFEESGVEALYNANCPTPAICIAVGANDGVGVILISHDGQPWQMNSIDGFDSVSEIECPSSNKCVAIGHIDDSNGRPLISDDGGETWQNGPILQLDWGSSLSCPTVLDCYLTGNPGIVFATHDGGQSWMELATGLDTQIRGIECPTSSHCLGRGYPAWLFRTMDGGQSWESFLYLAVHGISCISDQSCYAMVYNDYGPEIGIVFTDDFGTNWTDPLYKTEFPGTWGLECPSATFCRLVGRDGNILRLINRSELIHGQHFPLIGTH